MTQNLKSLEYFNLQNLREKSKVSFPSTFSMLCFVVHHYSDEQLGHLLTHKILSMLTFPTENDGVSVYNQ